MFTATTHKFTAVATELLAQGTRGPIGAAILGLQSQGYRERDSSYTLSNLLILIKDRLSQECKIISRTATDSPMRVGVDNHVTPRYYRTILMFCPPHIGSHSHKLDILPRSVVFHMTRRMSPTQRSHTSRFGTCAKHCKGRSAKDFRKCVSVCMKRR